MLTTAPMWLVGFEHSLVGFAVGVGGVPLGLLTFALPAFWMSTQPGFDLHHVWYLSVATVTLQMCMSLWLLRREMRRREAIAAVPAAA